MPPSPPQKFVSSSGASSLRFSIFDSQVDHSENAPHESLLASDIFSPPAVSALGLGELIPPTLFG